MYLSVLDILKVILMMILMLMNCVLAVYYLIF